MSSLIQADHPAVTKINDVIQHSAEGGLFVKWSKDNAAPDKYKSRDVVVGGLSLEHLGAGIICYILGNILACLAFLVERIVDGKLRAGNPTWFWVFIGMLIDDKRYIMLRRMSD